MPHKPLRIPNQSAFSGLDSPELLFEQH